MRKPFVAGNWKMNKTVAEATSFVTQVRDGLNAIDGIDIAFCVPFIDIPGVAKLLADTKIGVGAQNMYQEESGAFTGEISPLMLKPYCQYVILGHSERRAYFGESDAGVNAKAKAALAHGMTPIICVGETLEQNQAGETVEFVSGQVKGAFEGIPAAEAATIVIAYEPIWAIGTGLTASAEDADRIIGEAVRGPLRGLYGNDVAEQVRIQYGGSVKPGNIAGFMATENIDGALVGGASLKDSFIELVQNAV